MKKIENLFLLGTFFLSFLFILLLTFAKYPDWWSYVIFENERREYMKNFILNYLSDMEKKVLHYYLNGLSYSEIANKACISVKSTDNALQRIKRKLGRVLAGMKNS
jgi:DNA-directed RNA polymerase specialized sigma24 family protein